MEEIFQDIDNDTEHVNMIIPKYILNKKGQATGTELNIYCNDAGTIIIKEVTSS